MKRIILKITVICIIVTMAFSTTVFANNNVSKASEEVINVIKLLEIANGDENGNMNFDKNVTRAEFVKMVINASTSKETAANIKLNVSLFPDVKNSFWGASYISVAINNGLVNGYIDGTFKPNNNVTLEEAATIVLRLLGYSNTDLIGNYPSAQINKYKELDLDENISAVQGEILSREECMILIYNMLSAKTKSGNIYCTTLGYACDTENKLDYSALLKEKLDGPYITDKTPFVGISDFVPNENTVFVLNNTKSSADKITSGDVIYTNDVINCVYAYRKTATGVVTVRTDSTVTIGSKTYSISTTKAKQKLALGGEFSNEKAFVTLLLGIDDTVVDVFNGDLSMLDTNNDNASHIEIIASTISKAVYLNSDNAALNWKNKVPFNIEDSTVYFNGKKTETPSVDIHDVLYYSEPFKSVWIFRKTVSGTIENINTPANPTSVTVSGKTYSIVSSSASLDLSVYGEYDVGDRITLILGINDECVAVTDTGTTSNTLYGVVTDIGEKNYIDKNNNTYTAKYVTVCDTLNVSHTYEYENRHLNKGDVVKVTVSEKTVMSKLNSTIGRSNALLLSDSFKNGLFSNNCEIIEYSSGNTRKITPERLSGIIFEPELIINSNYILYFEFDTDNYVKRLILNDYTGDFDEYGVVIDNDEDNDLPNKKITYLIDREKKTFTALEYKIDEVPVKITTSSNSDTNLKPLTNKITNIVSFDGNKAYDSMGNSYFMADTVGYYIKTVSGYEASNIDDLLASDYEYTAYLDRGHSYGGRIRIIVATRKV